MQMIECFVKDDNGEFDVHVEVLARAMRPSIPHTVVPSRFGSLTIDVGGERWVDSSPEPPGLQVSFDDEIERELAERIVNDVITNLASMTGSCFRVVWVS